MIVSDRLWPEWHSTDARCPRPPGDNDRLVHLSQLSGLSLGPGPTPAPRDRVRQWIGLAAAAGLHAAALLALVSTSPSEPHGGGGQWLEAISVEVVPTSVIEARDAQHINNAAAANGPLAPDDGDASKSDAQASMAKHDRTAEDSTVDSAPADEALRQSEPNPPAAKFDDATPATPDKQPEPQSRGGVAALTPESTAAPATARASVSPGAIQRYAMQVRAALARNKPNGRGSRGTATVTFNISPSGSIGSAHVSASSGYSALDKAALAAVLHTSFPLPPASMSESELTYVVPFHFK
jgi:TonB family protein